MNEITLNTEKDVLDLLHAKDFRSISKKQLMNFVSNLPNMDKQVAIKCLEQFPNFTKYSNHMIDHFYDLCDSAIKEDGKETMQAYKLILDDLREIIKDKEISEEERHYVIDQMIIIGEKIESAEKDKRHFKENVLKAATAIAGLGLTIGGALLGLKINDRF